jgi:hypothetical protein
MRWPMKTPNWIRRLFRRQKSNTETAAQRADRLRRNLKHNPTTGELLVTGSYWDACIDEILESWRYDA